MYVLPCGLVGRKIAPRMESCRDLQAGTSPEGAGPGSREKTWGDNTEPSHQPQPSF